MENINFNKILKENKNNDFLLKKRGQDFYNELIKNIVSNKESNAVKEKFIVEENNNDKKWLECFAFWRKHNYFLSIFDGKVVLIKAILKIKCNDLGEKIDDYIDFEIYSNIQSFSNILPICLYKTFNSKGDIIYVNFANKIKDCPLKLYEVVMDMRESTGIYYNIERNCEVFNIGGYQRPKENNNGYDLSNTLFFLQKVAFKNNPFLYEVFMDFIADMIQNPFKKKGCAFAFVSEIQGVGKSLILLMLKGIFKQYSKINTITSDLTNRFNSNMANKILVGFDDFESYDKNDYSIHKRFITLPSLRVELKGINAIQEPDNFARVVYTSNKISIFENMKNEDRRINIHKLEYVFCKDKTIKKLPQYEIKNNINTKFYNYLANSFENENWQQQFAYFLSKREIKSNLYYCENTETKTSIIEESDYYNFFENFFGELATGSCVTRKIEHPFSNDKVSFQNLFDNIEGAIPFKYIIDAVQNEFKGQNGRQIKSMILRVVEKYGIKTGNNFRFKNSNEKNWNSCNGILVEDIIKIFKGFFKTENLMQEIQKTILIPFVKDIIKNNSNKDIYEQILLVREEIRKAIKENRFEIDYDNRFLILSLKNAIENNIFISNLIINNN